MKKLMLAVIVLGASVSQARVGEITTVVCQSEQRNIDYGYGVSLSHDLKANKDVLRVSESWIGGVRQKQEVAVIDKSRPVRIGGGVTYLSDSYVFTYNATTSPTAGFYRGSLFAKANHLTIALKCRLTR